MDTTNNIQNKMNLTVKEFKVGDIVKCKKNNFKVEILYIYEVERERYESNNNKNANFTNKIKAIFKGKRGIGRGAQVEKGSCNLVPSENIEDYLRVVDAENRDESCGNNHQYYVERMYKLVILEDIGTELASDEGVNGVVMELNEKELYEMLIIGTLPTNSVLTHNCMQRLVCGQLGSVASRMALDNMQATTIDGRHKGAGMVKAQGIISHIQYYFEETNWITDWFTSRGMTNKGYDISEDPNAAVDPLTIDLGEDEDISISEKKTVIEFDSIKKEIDNTKDQHFDEV